MFSKTNPQKPQTSQPRKPAARPVNSAPSILGTDISIKGDITCDGDIQIDGRHEGNVTANKLTIGEQGAVIGSVNAKSVHVRGKVNGKINANLVELAATANVQADITQDQLTIANGAFFDGKCTRLTKTPPVQTTTPASVSPAPIGTQTKKSA